jgi:hypothetical protein
MNVVTTSDGAVAAGSPPVPVPVVVQRKCACGGTPGADGECAECRAKRLQRHGVGAAPPVVPPGVTRVLRSPGRPLDTATRAYMEPRFGHDFSRVRVHVDGAADASARALNADAYTVGESIAFADGRFEPGSASGRALLAHELAHVLQQQRSAAAGGAAFATTVDPDPALEAEAEAVSRRVAAGRPAAATARATGDLLQRSPAGHITEVRVNQTTPEKVTATWSDGHVDSDECSSGKGHCCFDGATGVAEGGVCSAARSTDIGNNCTPVGTFKVTARVPKTSGGIEFWTQFHDGKSVALHDYDPLVDGTPLSHGCVRLHRDFAKTIFDGAQVGVTRVVVENLARPRCDNGDLVAEWEGDVRDAGKKPPDGTQINPDTKKLFTRAEIASEKRHIKETRDELRSAFGVDEAGLDKKLAGVTTSKDVRALIPRCVPALTVEEKGLPAAEKAGTAGDAAKTGAALDQALRRARDERAAAAAVKAAAASLAAAAAATAEDFAVEDDATHWTRLALSSVIRQYNPRWAKSADEVRRLQEELLSLLTTASSAATPAPAATHGSKQ